MTVQTNKSENQSWRFQFGFLFFGYVLLLQFKIEKLTSPNMTFQFDHFTSR